MTSVEKNKIIALSITAVLLAVLLIVLIFVNAACSDGDNMAEISSDPSSLQSDISSDTMDTSSFDLSQSSSDVSDDTSSEDESSATSEKPGNAVVTSSNSDETQISVETGEWYLRLVNAKYVLPDDFSPTLSTISMDYARDEGMKFDSRAIDNLEAMCAAAKQDGINLLVISAYRTYSLQEGLYNNKVSFYLNQGYGEEEAGDLAATVVARPKTSEHNLGLAVDFNDVEERFDQTDEYKWLRAHCAEYGFIMRYAKETRNITGVIYEPWHYRYVGKDVATYITEKNITLEEFLGKQ